MATNGSFAHQDQFKAVPENTASAPADAGADNANLSKDEVGWYFVEQYYTTLSKSPEKLHLFYSKRSQFVFGNEAQVANVVVGRQAIQDRIKELNFQDCKVRVSNVDAQASSESIVIQVIGETSNNGAEPKKFAQTFVLAQQPSGYFVLNDIWRYIDEDGEDEITEEETTEEAAPEVAAEEPAKIVEPVAVPTADKKVAAVPDIAKRSAPVANGAETEQPKQAEAPKETPAAVETAVAEVAEEAKEAEKPKARAPTPAPKAQAPAEPAAPPKPMTWASRAAAAAGPRPVVPLPKTATPPATNQSRAPAPAAATPAATAAAATPAAEAAPKESSGWQTAGADSKRQKGAQAAGSAAEKDSTMGYVKHVTDKVQDAELRAALAVHGELSYFDINRQKNCAFVEYKTLEGYQAAIASAPTVVNGESISVEPRHQKAAGRGNAPARNRADGGRTGGQANGRGNASGQNRGRGGARARGGAQASA